MIYAQNLEGCFLESQQNELDKRHQSEALSKFREAYRRGDLGPLSQVENSSDIQSFQESIQKLSGLETVIILGTGGSSLGGQAIYALASQKKPQLCFVDNIDPHTFSKLFQTYDPQRTGILAVSKSGSTVETLMQVLTCMKHFKTDHYMVVTEPTDNPLRRLANENNWLCLDHPTNVGGRYSCFSIVGLIPLILAGLDPFAFRRGAKSILSNHLNSEDPSALQGAATAVYLEKHQGKTQSVMMPYADQLNLLSSWYCQLWAESLGKQGKGTTPIRALGTVDQHSQLQLYLDGPKDKFFTLLSPNWRGKGDMIDSAFLPEFQGKTMGDLFEAELKATYKTLIANQCPTRLITINKIDEETLGALMMHFMIETILASYLLDVNAFDQPAVEQGKKLAREYLAA